MLKHRKAVVAMLALAVAGVFILPTSSASAGSATVSNACANSVTANFSQIDVTTSGDDGLTTVAPGGATSTTVSQQAAIPGAIFVAGYNLGLLVVGVNNIPASVITRIEGTNTTQGTQTTNLVGGNPPDGSVTVTTTITDPDGTPGTGDESATPASFSVNYNNLNWTAGASGTINYRQESIATSPPTDANNTLRIHALVGGFLNVFFRCAPGTVTPPDPGTITLIDPAPGFDSFATQIEPPPRISINDQTVTEGGAANLTVSLDAPSAAPVTVDFATTDGTALAPGDYTSATGTVTFAPGDTAETVTVQTIDDPDTEPAETFFVNLSNAMGNAAIDDPQGVGTIPANDQLSNISINDVSMAEPSSGQTAFQFTVSLDMPQADPVTVDFATADGTATVADNDYASATGTVTFAPGDTSEPVTVLVNGDTTAEADETFFVNLLNATGNANIADAQGVGTILCCPPPVDAAGEVIVSGPVKAGATTKVYVFRVSNVGTVPIAIDPATEIDGAVLVNGTENGTVTAITGPKTISPGARARFRLRWTGTTPLVAGDIVEFTACVKEPGDIDPTNNCGSQTRTAG